MSWYNNPVQPIDPVIVSQTPKPPVRYMRDNFANTGQNSHLKPPAQDPAMWQSLLNVQPITQGILNQRWGYTPFVNTFALFRTINVSFISYFGAYSHVAVIRCADTSGLSVGAPITVSGNSNSIFNTNFVVNTISSSTTFSVVFPAQFSGIAGTGGIITFAGTNGKCNRLYSFQSDSLNTRAIIAASLDGVLAYNETGTPYNSDIFIPTASNGIIRSITSRNYQYFCDGNNALDPATHLTGDSLKWNGAKTGGISNIGIVNTDVLVNGAGGGSSSNTVGPNTNSVSVDQADGNNPWSSNNVNLYEQLNVTEPYPGHLNYVFSNQHLTSNNLRCDHFNFSSVSGTIAGIAVTYTYRVTPNVPNGMTAYPSLSASLIKNGVPVGGSGGNNITADGQMHTITFGGATSLWGASWAPADIANIQFGVQHQASVSMGFMYGNPGFGSYNPQCSVFVGNPTITIYLSGSTGTSGTSGTGIGIINGVGGGSINLTLGRTYYLVPSNSLTGHFGDLSDPSGSTGATLNAEFNLLLATYNDPQVDTKYVLATDDGGDPSILYEALVLVPGFTISSWAINGSNQVTFTGVYTSPQFPVGATTIIGGLAHGSYMNGTTLTVTAATGTTFTAAFTHAADSATEVGIAGAYSNSVPNGVTYVVDNTAEPDLVVNQPLVFTDTFGNEFGLTLNDPPPAGDLIVKHQGRLWMAGVPNASHSVFFSKSVAELTLPNGFIAGKYEESWPGSNYFDVSDGAESVSGLLSDGTTLYIGTQNHIRRLIGNSPFNFQQPQIVHPEVGLINQEVWQLTFMQGAPSGTVWMTPDYRVIQSDFNTYIDIGSPIQDILNNLQPSAGSLAHASFVADGEFELYILAVPYKQATYCDLHLVFDLRSRHWFIWQPTDGSLSVLYNVTQTGVPQWLFINGLGNAINIYSQNAYLDNGVAFPVSATTTWMSLGEPTRRKLLNEVQVYGNPAMSMNVYGANNLANFSSPIPVVYNRALRQSPFGVWTLYMTGDRSRHRYYQFGFNATSGPSSAFLGSYAIALAALDDI